MTNPIVIDISHHQPDPIDWVKVKSGGTIGVIHKATEGIGYVDDKLFSRMKAAKAAGVLTSTYHFMRENDPVGQMQFYLDTINPVLGERICLDHECSGTSLDELEQAIVYLSDTRPDLQITIYSGHQIKEQLGGGRSDVLAENTSLWIAQYASTVSWPTATWPRWSLWQFSQEEKCSGIDGYVDGNRWNGSEEALVKWLSPAGVAPAPPPSRTVRISVSAPTDVEVEIEVNGEPVP